MRPPTRRASPTDVQSAPGSWSASNPQRPAGLANRFAAGRQTRPKEFW